MRARLLLKNSSSSGLMYLWCSNADEPFSADAAAIRACAKGTAGTQPYPVLSLMPFGVDCTFDCTIAGASFVAGSSPRGPLEDAQPMMQHVTAPELAACDLQMAGKRSGASCPQVHPTAAYSTITAALERTTHPSIKFFCCHQPETDAHAPSPTCAHTHRCPAALSPWACHKEYRWSAAAFQGH